MNSASRSFLLLMADVTIRATVLLALTAIIATLSRRASASFRHLVLALGLGCILVLPLLTVALPSWKIAVKTSAILPHSVSVAPQVQQASQAPTEAVVPPPTSFHPDAPLSAADHALSTGKAVVTHPAPLPSAAPVHPRLTWSAWVSMLWVLGVVLVLAQLLRGLATVKKIERESAPAMNGSALELLAQAKTLMKVRRPVAIRQASDRWPITVPLTYGVLHPVILLPVVPAQWPQERLRAVLLHEMAHVRRTDWSLQILMHIACAFYWFHPLVWICSRWARAESETAADDLVLASGMPAQDYARELLDVALSARRQGNLGLGALAMAQTPKIEGRLRLILSLGRRRGEIGGRARAMILAVAVCVLAVGSVVRVASRAAATDGGGPIPSSRVRKTDVLNPRVILPNGVVVTLLGVKDTQAGPGGGWRPDGTPLTDPLPTRTLVFPSLPAGVRGRAFAITTTFGLYEQPKFVWAAPPNFTFAYERLDPSFYIAHPSFTWGFQPKDYIKQLPIQYSETTFGNQTTVVSLLPLSFEASAKTVTVRYGVAAGPWTESVTCGKAAGKISIPTASGQVIFTLIPNPHNFTDPRAVARDRAVFMVSDHLGNPPGGTGVGVTQDYDRDVVALDRMGRVVYDLRGSTHMNDGSGRTQQTSTVPNSVLKRVASFRFLARPYQWAEFKGVQLQPQTSANTVPTPLAGTRSQNDTAAAHVALGQQLQQKGQPRDGIPEFRKAVQINPNDAEAQYQLAQALYQINWKRTGNSTESLDTPPAVLDEALLHLRKAVALHPENAEWHSLLGGYLENRGKYAEAATFYRRALHLLGPTRYMSVLHRITADGSGKAGEVYDNQYSLGDVLLKMGQYREAAVHYQEALRYNPQADWVLLGYGDALHELGRREEARAAWEKCVAVQPPNPYYQRQAKERLARQ